MRKREIVFETLPSTAEEVVEPSLSPRDLVALNAAIKATDVAGRCPGRVVVGADTVVALEGKIFGKPRELPEALGMLLQLSGRTHEVFTGVHVERLLPDSPPQTCRFVEVTRVRFRSFNQETAEQFLKEVPVLDKAGAYAAQEDHGRLIETIEGCRDSVVGLPVDRLLACLRTHFSGVVVLPPQ